MNQYYRAKGEKKAQECYDDPECCDLEINIHFAIISSVVSFYIPLVIMIFVYARVFSHCHTTSAAHRQEPFEIPKWVHGKSGTADDPRQQQLAFDVQ